MRRTSLFGQASATSRSSADNTASFLQIWVIFRRYLWLLAFLSAFISIIVAVVHNPSPDNILLSSAVLSLCWTLLVILSYVQIRQWRRHPSYLLLQRVLTSFVFSLLILLKEAAAKQKHNTCEPYKAGLLEFAVISGELWFVALSADLFSSLTDPFASYSFNARRFTVLVVGVAGIASAMLSSGLGNCVGTFETTGGITLCWINNTREFSGGCFWCYFVGWVLIFYFISVASVYFAFQRLAKGLDETYATRSAVVTTTSRIVSAHLLYGLVLGLTYALATSSSGGDVVFAFMIGIRGWWDSVLWFSVHGFKHKRNGRKKAGCCGIVNKFSSGQINSERQDPLLGEGREVRASRVSFAAVLMEIDDDDEDGDDEGGKPYDEEEDNDDEVDPTPQLNLALRREVLHLVTAGIRTSVERWEAREEEKRATAASNRCYSEDAPSSRMASVANTSQHIGLSFGWSMVSSAARTLLRLPRSPGEYVEDRSSSSSSTRHRQSLDQDSSTSPNPSPSEVVFDLDEDEKHRFRDFLPATFSSLRALAGFSSQRYLELMTQPAREKLLSFGGSGSFQFQCGKNEEVIVKTITPKEADALVQRIAHFHLHLQAYPDSFLVRFLGLHALTLFGREFFVVVMANVFPDGTSVNERYDIKGSWVGRRAQPVVPGSRQNCRHCHESFRVGATKACTCSVGLQGHEPSMILKDNDLNERIRLRPEDCWSVIEQLHRDSDLLSKLGIMDYSMVLGVRKKEYDIDVTSSITSSGSAGLATTEKLVDERASDISTADCMSTLSTAETVVNLHMSCLGPQKRLGKIIAAGPAVGSAEDDFELSRDSDFAAGVEEGADGRVEGFAPRSVVAPMKYYIGIVDVLQEWTVRKRLERFFRIHFLLQSAEGISCSPPEEYRVRFQAKISRTFDHSLFVREITGGWSGSRYLSQPTHVAR